MDINEIHNVNEIDTPFQRWLSNEGACTEGRLYVGDKTPQQFWDTCGNREYMIWLMTNLRTKGFSTPMAECGCHFQGDIAKGEENYIDIGGPSVIRERFPVLPDFLPQPASTSVAVEDTAGSERTIFHVILPENTVTFLSEGERDQFYDDSSTGVKCESTVTETVYGALVEMREDSKVVR